MPLPSAKQKLAAVADGRVSDPPLLFVKYVQNQSLNTAEMHKESVPFFETLAGMRLAVSRQWCYDEDA